MVAAMTSATTAAPSGHRWASPTRRRSRQATVAAAIRASPSTIAAVVARPGSRISSGATTTRAANPVAPESHAGRRRPSSARIARPASSEAAQTIRAQA